MQGRTGLPFSDQNQIALLHSLTPEFRERCSVVQVSGTAHLPDCAGVAARHLHVDPVAWSGQIVLQLSIFPLATKVTPNSRPPSFGSPPSVFAVLFYSSQVRVLKTPLGNALLVGVGGSGRKSLATLGTFVAEFQTQTAQLVTAWATGGTVGTGAFEAFREMWPKLFLGRCSQTCRKHSVFAWPSIPPAMT